MMEDAAGGKAGFENAVADYLKMVENDHEHGDECEAREGFYLIGYIADDGGMVVYGGGHRTEPSTLVEATVGAVDGYMQKNLTDLPPVLRFARSRDMFHSAADSVPPSPDVAMALSQFVTEINGEGEDSDL